jgi:hypothetical protein
MASANANTGLTQFLAGAAAKYGIDPSILTGAAKLPTYGTTTSKNAQGGTTKTTTSRSVGQVLAPLLGTNNPLYLSGVFKNAPDVTSTTTPAPAAPQLPNMPAAAAPSPPVHINPTTGQTIPLPGLKPAAMGSVGPVTPASLQSLAKARGWDQNEVNSWLRVIQMESGGSTTAQNPKSSAYGIAQFINGPSEYAQYGGDANTQAGQLTAMANYIKQRYGTPSAAVAFHLQHNWY